MKSVWNMPPQLTYLHYNPNDEICALHYVCYAHVHTRVVLHTRVFVDPFSVFRKSGEIQCCASEECFWHLLVCPTRDSIKQLPTKFNTSGVQHTPALNAKSHINEHRRKLIK